MIKGIIPRYIIGEIFPNYLIGLGFLSVILFVVQVFNTIRLVVEKNVPVDKVAKLLILYIPLILQFTLPIAVVVGVILAIGRLSDDSEIIAMRSCGISLFQVFIPSFWFGIFVTIFTLGFYEFILPVAAEKYAEANIEIYQINPTGELSKSLSYNSIDGVRITVDQVDTATNELTNVRINYINENKLIFARKALLLAKDYEKNAFPLVLFNSTMQPANIKQPNIDKRFDEQFNIRQIIYIPDRPSDAIVPVGNQLWGLCEFYENISKREFELSLYTYRDYNRLKTMEIDIRKKKAEFRDFLKNNKAPSDPKELKKYNEKLLDKKINIKKLDILIKRLKTVIEKRQSPQGRMAIRNEQYLFQRKIAFSFAALMFSLLGAPLGIFSKRAGKSLGLGLSILIIVVFFVMIFLGNFFMRKEIMSPMVSAWYGVWVLLVYGVYLIYDRITGNPGKIFFYMGKFLKKLAEYTIVRKINKVLSYVLIIFDPFAFILKKIRSLFKKKKGK